ncbi:hypothetical protein ZIOFF_008538 [Zingiber officinale]|uniref:Nodulin-like domain-containing protein n=1 Tax=Zingiber officinale TaxID=94328 RepID=A0A8J5I3J0_ZINOF|nr:hypothetical protein ZIOFF_008538 [Zingiber officinale]
MDPKGIMEKWEGILDVLRGLGFSLKREGGHDSSGSGQHCHQEEMMEISGTTTGWWLGLVTVMWVQCISDNNYTFSNYSEALKTLMGLT